MNIPANLRSKYKTLFEEDQSNINKRTIFREAKDSVMETLRDDNLIRYMKSDIYKSFIQKMTEQRSQETKGRPNPSPISTPTARKTPVPSKKSGGGANEFSHDEIFELMIRVYEDVKESNDSLIALLEFEDSAGSPPLVITDFEMFLANEGNEMPKSQPRTKKVKEKKQKDKDKKPGLWARMTKTEEKRRKKEAEKGILTESPQKKHTISDANDKEVSPSPLGTPNPSRPESEVGELSSPSNK
jgi:hypothetical protein